MKLIFETPSKRCPFRHLNGQEVTIVRTGPLKVVRRIGGVSRVFFIKTEESQVFPAFADELFLDPI